MYGVSPIEFSLLSKPPLKSPSTFPFTTIFRLIFNSSFVTVNLVPSIVEGREALHEIVLRTGIAGAKMHGRGELNNAEAIRLFYLKIVLMCGRIGKDRPVTTEGYHEPSSGNEAFPAIAANTYLLAILLPLPWFISASFRISYLPATSQEHYGNTCSPVIGGVTPCRVKHWSIEAVAP